MKKGKNIICKICGKSVYRRPSAIGKYCSRFCSLNEIGFKKGHQLVKKTGRIINCLNCGKEVYKAKWQLYLNAKFCSQNCRGQYQSIIFIGKNNPKWKGGKINKDGYVLIYQPTHPFCNHLGYVYEHRFVMEKKLGRYLKLEEVIHHINGIRNDNRTENLYLFNNSSEHTKHHHLLKNHNVKINL